MMKFIVSGIINIPNGKRKFSKEIKAKSKNHAKDIVYAFFGSKNGIIRSKIKIENILEVQ